MPLFPEHFGTVFVLTGLAIQDLKPTGKQYLKWDMPNFRVLVSQRGTKSFVVPSQKV